MKFLTLVFLTTSLFFSVLNPAQAQDSLNVITAEARIIPLNENWPTNKKKGYAAFVETLRLKEGNLVVVLATNTKKLMELRSILRNDKLSEEGEKNIRREIEETIENTNFINKSLIESFQSIYKFSTTYFLFDTSLIHLKNGVLKGYFLNEDLTLNPEISISDAPAYLCSHRLISAANATKGLVITDLEMNRFESPFPSATSSSSSGWLNFLSLIMKEDKYRTMRIEKDIEALQEQLEEIIEKGTASFLSTVNE